MKRTALFVALVIAGSANSADTVPYPENFRSWSHVKSGVIGPQHKSFASSGGLHHVYANQEAMAGYRTRQFPEHSMIVFEWLEWAEKDGAYLEGPRRQVDVMVKDSQRYAATGGWGFQRFVKSTRELASTPTPEDCFACHNRLKEDGLVLSKYRE
jgi:cytochrome P460